ncbi:hypothetical protein BH09PAT1_BH09PAT1_8540 [soil metagenome]
MVSYSGKLRTSLKTFLILFTSVHVLNVILLLLVMGFWDGGLSIGLPKAFYIINCGFILDPTQCPTGFNFLGLIIDIMFWYIVAIVLNYFLEQKLLKIKY